MTYQEKLTAMWAQADAQTADKRNRGRFLVMAKTGLPAQARVSGSAAAKTRGLNDEDGHPFLTVVVEEMKADHELMGWEAATRPTAVPDGVEFTFAGTTLTAKLSPVMGMVPPPVDVAPLGGILDLAEALEHSAAPDEEQPAPVATEQLAAPMPPQPKAGPGRPKAKQDDKD